MGVSEFTTIVVHFLIAMIFVIILYLILVLTSSQYLMIQEDR